jgi:hypothetical protein
MSYYKAFTLQTEIGLQNMRLTDWKHRCLVEGNQIGN